MSRKRQSLDDIRALIQVQSRYSAAPQGSVAEDAVFDQIKATLVEIMSDPARTMFLVSGLVMLIDAAAPHDAVQRWLTGMEENLP